MFAAGFIEVDWFAPDIFCYSAFCNYFLISSVVIWCKWCAVPLSGLKVLVTGWVNDGRGCVIASRIDWFIGWLFWFQMMLTQKNCSLLQDHDPLKSHATSAGLSSASHDLGMSQKRWLLAPSNMNNVADKHSFSDSGLTGYPVHNMLPSNPMLNVARVPVYPPEETSVRPLTSDMKYPTVQALQPQILMVPQPSERARHSSSSSPIRQPQTVPPRASLHTPEPVLAGSWKDPPPILSGFKESGYTSEGAGRVLGEFGRGSGHRLSGSTREPVARPVLQRLNAVPTSPTGRNTATRPPLPMAYLPYRQQGPHYRDTAEYKVWGRLCQDQ